MSVALASFRKGHMAARLLIVEDDETNRKLALAMCQAGGHACAVACDGEEALARLGAADFDLVLVDLRMPKLDGISLTRILRAPGPWATLPILGVTATTSAATHRAMADAGMDAILTKPFRRRDLMAAIDRLLAPRPL